jgi:hypothetical protein
MNDKIDDIHKFFKICEYYVRHNIERGTGLPTNTKLQNSYKYLLIFLDLSNGNLSTVSDCNKNVIKYFKNCSYSEEDITEIIQRSAPQEKLYELLDFCESYLVDEIEKDMYGHGDRCYTTLYDDLSLILRIKQQKYNYKYKNVHDLLVNGYYFKEEIADKFVQLAASHTPEECPD